MEFCKSFHFYQNISFHYINLDIYRNTLTIHISIDSIDKIYALEINSNVTKGYYARFSKVFKYRKSFYTQLSLDYITSFLQKTN